MSRDAVDLKSIFGQAREIESPAERAEFLNKACADPAARAEVERLLSAAVNAGDFMRGPAVEFGHTAPFSRVNAGPGTVIGPYKLMEQIGEGGFGLVFVAEQQQPIRRMVALKIIKPGMDTRDVVARFEAERQALAMMDHPNIARVFDGGTTNDGRPYFVMELVKGIPITDYCDQRRLAVRDRLDLFMQVCQAVQHAHQKGIIHRDIKPTNVLVTEHDGRPVPKVIDFGLVKALQGPSSLTDRTLYTAFGAMVGTPLYMAPEQVGINALDIDTRTDVYALGVILYELLTGSTPLEKKQFKEAAWDEVCRLIREEDAPLPSTRVVSSEMLARIAACRHIEPEKLGRLIRGDLDWIVVKALEKDRNRRYESANSLASDIQRYLANEPVTARQPTSLYRFQKMVRRNKLAFTAASSVAAALVIGTVLSTMFAVRAFRSAADARSSAEQAQRSAQIAQSEKDRANEQAAQVALERESAQDSLSRSLYDQARFVLGSGQTGRRWDTLNLVKKAEALRARQRVNLSASGDRSSSLPTQTELRNEAIAAMLLLDVRQARQIDLATVGLGFSLTRDARFAAGIYLQVNPATPKGSTQGSSAGISIVDVATGSVRAEHTWGDSANSPDFSPYALALSPDGKLLAFVAPRLSGPRPMGWHIEFWELPEFKLQPRVLDWNQEGASPSTLDRSAILTARLGFSPDGRWLVAVNQGACVIWDMQTDQSKVLATMKPTTPLDLKALQQSLMQTQSTSFSPDGRRMALTNENTVRVWQVASDEPPTEIELPLPCRGGVDFSPSEPIFAVPCGDAAKETVLLWDIDKDAERTRFELEPSPAAPVLSSFDPQGKLLAISAGQKISIYDVATKATVLEIGAENNPLGVRHIQWEPDGRHLISIGLQGSLQRWELSPDPPRSRVPVSGGPFARFTFSPDGKWLATTTIDSKSGRLIERATGRVVRELGGYINISFRPDGRQLALWTVPQPPSRVTSAAVAAAEKQTLAGLISRIVVEEVESGHEVATASGNVYDFAFNADGHLVAMMRRVQDKLVSLWDVNSNTVVWQPPEINLPNQASISRVLGNDGKLAAFVTSNIIANETQVSFCQVPSGHTLADWSQPGTVAVHRLSPDNRWFALCSMNLKGLGSKNVFGARPVADPLAPSSSPGGRDILWSVSVHGLPPNESSWTAQFPDIFTGMTFSPDGQLLAVPLRNGVVQIWSTERGEQLYQLKMSGQPAQSLSFTPDGQSLAWLDEKSESIEILDLAALRRQLADVGLDW